MRVEEINNKKILFGILNWGLGHATRSSVIIDELIEKNELTIVSNGSSGEWLKRQYPDLKHRSFPEFDITYSSRLPASLAVLFQLPKLLKKIRNDHSFARQCLKEDNYDLIISDNCYGFYHEGVRSILITHQFQFAHPANALLQLPMHSLWSKFDTIWIPDEEDHSIGGLMTELPSGLKPKVSFIGLLSRFNSGSLHAPRFRFCIIASGPSPRKEELISYFENNLAMLDYENVLIDFDGGNESTRKKGELTIARNIGDKDLEEYIDKSEFVICRSGYSSIMDLLKKKNRPF